MIRALTLLLFFALAVFTQPAQAQTILGVELEAPLPRLPAPDTTLSLADPERAPNSVHTRMDLHRHDWADREGALMWAVTQGPDGPVMSIMRLVTPDAPEALAGYGGFAFNRTTRTEALARLGSEGLIAPDAAKFEDGPVYWHSYEIRGTDSLVTFAFDKPDDPAGPARLTGIVVTGPRMRAETMQVENDTQAEGYAPIANLFIRQ